MPTAATARDARELTENLMDVMSALLGVIERETELVRAGKLAEAMAFQPNKAELSRGLRLQNPSLTPIPA